MFHDSPVQGILQDWKLEVPLVKLPAELRQVSYLHTYMATLGGSIWGSLLIMSTYPILNANHTHRNVPSRLQWSKLVFVQCRVPSEKCSSAFSPYPSFSSSYTSSLSSFKMLFNSPRPTRGFLPEFLLFLILTHIFPIFWLLAKPPGSLRTQRQRSEPD